MSTTTEQKTPNENARAMMNRKPVYWAPPGSVLNLDSGFKPKKLCDGPTFSTGLACVYSCSFCYVSAQLGRHPIVTQIRKDGHAFEDVVIRRKNALDSLESALLDTKGKPRYKTPEDTRVIYSSPLVDVAANMELVKETIEACKIILRHTNWQIRLLSKSSFLPFVANGIPSEYKHRMIFGVSTGTLDDATAAAFEGGTALVSKRIASIRDLQDDGWRTFGMICPSLPQNEGEYEAFSRAMAEAIRAEKMEHIWGEVINVRGESMRRTYDALNNAGLRKEAKWVMFVSQSANAWETYARSTFEAHVKVLPAGKLRFLQYVDDTNIDWWKAREADGATLLGHLVH